MSLSDAQAVFVGIHEDGLNDLIAGFCHDRPRYLSYGSPAFVPSTTVSDTAMDAIAFPGVSGGIQWSLQLSVPKIDLFKQTDPLPPELTLSAGQFSARLSAKLCIECRKLRLEPRPPRPNDDYRFVNHDKAARDDHHPLSEVTCFGLTVFAVGHLERVLSASGADAVALAVDAVEIVDIKPDELESFLECLMFLILQAVFAGIRIPLEALRVGAFALTPTVGPLIEDDQIKMRGVV